MKKVLVSEVMEEIEKLKEFDNRLVKLANAMDKNKIIRELTGLTTQSIREIASYLSCKSFNIEYKLKNCKVNM